MSEYADAFLGVVLNRYLSLYYGVSPYVNDVRTKKEPVDLSTGSLGHPQITSQHKGGSQRGELS